jgi:hypothetical protein
MIGPFFGGKSFSCDEEYKKHRDKDLTYLDA